TRNTPTSAWYLLPNNKSPSTAVIRITSRIRASTWISAFSEPTRTANQPEWRITSKGARPERRAAEWFLWHGDPGAPSRLCPVAELEYLRDYRLPYALERLNNLEVALLAYSGRSDENARRAKEDLFGVQNSRKAYNGELAGILDPVLMEGKQKEEQKLREIA